MELWQIVSTALVLLYIAVCFGKIAARHGKNPLLCGLIAVISPINLIILGIWAFSGGKHRRS